MFIVPVLFFPFTEFFIIITTFSLGFFVNNLINLNDKNKILNYSEICLYGFCFILPFSQFVNLFIPLSEFFFG